MVWCIVYRFTLIAPSTETDARFIACWSGMTGYFARECGALGSRLHRGADGRFVAYAQWPDRATCEASREHIPRADFMPLRLEWSELCQPSEVLFEGEMVADIAESPRAQLSAG